MTGLISIQVFDDLVKDLNEIIRMTLQINDDEDFAEMRAEIEILFKATKALFGLKDLHIYYSWRFRYNVSVRWMSLYAVLYGEWVKS